MDKKNKFNKINNYRKEIRKDRINKIKEIISIVSRNGRKASYRLITAEFCLSEGLSKRIVKEYLDLLVESGQVIREGDELSPKHIKKEINEELNFLR